MTMLFPVMVDALQKWMTCAATSSIEVVVCRAARFCNSSPTGAAAWRRRRRTFQRERLFVSGSAFCRTRCTQMRSSRITPRDMSARTCPRTPGPRCMLVCERITPCWTRRSRKTGGPWLLGAELSMYDFHLGGRVRWSLIAPRHAPLEPEAIARLPYLSAACLRRRTRDDDRCRRTWPKRIRPGELKLRSIG